MGIRETCIEARNYRYARSLARLLYHSFAPSLNEGVFLAASQTRARRESLCGRILSVSEFRWVARCSCTSCEKDRCVGRRASDVGTTCGTALHDVTIVFSFFFGNMVRPEIGISSYVSPRRLASPREKQRERERPIRCH